MNKQRGNADEGLVWILVAVAVLLGLWGYAQVKAFASWINVDMDTAMGLIGRGALLIGLLVAALWVRLFQRVWTYLPAGFFFCAIPVLDYKAKDYIAGFAMNTTNLPWYGSFWGQLGIFVGLVAIGYLLAKWLDS